MRDLNKFLCIIPVIALLFASLAPVCTVSAQELTPEEQYVVDYLENFGWDVTYVEYNEGQNEWGVWNCALVAIWTEEPVINFQFTENQEAMFKEGKKALQQAFPDASVYMVFILESADSAYYEISGGAYGGRVHTAYPSEYLKYADRDYLGTGGQGETGATEPVGRSPDEIKLTERDLPGWRLLIEWCPTQPENPNHLALKLYPENENLWGELVQYVFVEPDENAARERFEQLFRHAYLGFNFTPNDLVEHEVIGDNSAIWVSPSNAYAVLRVGNVAGYLLVSLSGASEDGLENYVLTLAEKVKSRILGEVEPPVPNLAQYLAPAAGQQAAPTVSLDQASITQLVENLEQRISELELKIEQAENLLAQAIAAGRVGASLSVGVEGGNPRVSKDFEHLVSVRVSNVVVNHRVDLEVSSDLKGGRTVLLNISHEVLPPGQLRVLFDNQEIPMADDYADVLNPDDDESAEYLILVGAKGAQVLVSIPGFSTHTITITTLPTQPVAQLPPLGVAVFGGIALVAAVAFIVWRNLRRGAEAGLQP